MQEVQLGPFVLDGVLGRGGMGQVFRANHPTLGQSVAIKVLMGDAATDADARQTFENEVRAVARLDHPGIVMVLDSGRIDALASLASGGRLVEGSPYLVMELASAGSLKDLRRPLLWPDIQSVLLGILDALAHAHARGVIHRDLKPGNILMCADHDLRPGLKLSDFGIATALDWHVKSGAVSLMAGTLHYMAPEQVLGSWRQYGPWTDLYALGCLAWRMVVGRVPFTGKSGPALMRAQLLSAPERYEPQVPVPEGLERWLRRLLRKPQFERFQSAADAAYALAQLPPVEDPGEGELLFARSQVLPVREPSLVASSPVLEGSELPPIERPPVPETWRHPLPPEARPSIVGAGRGLFGVRSVPFVDRSPARDRLWELLRVTTHGGLRAAVIEGPEGVGRSALLRWFCERAAEVGAAHPILVRCSSSDSPGDALRRAMIGQCRGEGLDVFRLEERLEEWLEGYDYTSAEISILAQSVRSTDTSLKSLMAASMRWVRRKARRRPVILALDDVHFAAEFIRVARGFFQGDDVEPVLVVATLPSESRGAIEMALKWLEPVDPVHISLEPLSDRHLLRLVRRLLPLDEGLAVQVVDRSGGFPGFAVELIGDWVARDVLVPTPKGFMVPPEELEQLPQDRAELWQSRIDDTLIEGDNGACLEVAATLGRNPTWSAWSAACGRGLPELTRKVDPFVRCGWVSYDDQQLCFEEPTLREALLERSRAAGRSNEQLQRAVGVLRGLPEAERRPERLGRLLLQAGQLEEGVERLLQGAQQQLDHGSPSTALALLERAQIALARAGVESSDLRFGKIAVARARCFSRQDRYEESYRISRQALEVAVPNGWLAIRPELWDVHGEALFRRDQRKEALRVYDELRTWARQHNQPQWLARAQLETARIVAVRGDVHKARVFAEGAREQFEQLGDSVGMARAVYVLATHCSEGDESVRRYREAAQGFADAKLYREQAACVNGLAEEARHAGDLGEAEARYREAAELFVRGGSGAAALPELNLALLYLKQRRFAEAHRSAEKSRQGFEEINWLAFSAASHAATLPCVAQVQDWTRWDRHMAQIIEILRQTGFREQDLAWVLRFAGDQALAKNDGKRARIAYRLARGQYAAMRMLDEVEEVDLLIDKAALACSS